MLTNAHVIEGHTDNVGSDDLNMDLSNRRAYAVQSYLADRGISGSRLSSAGMGESNTLRHWGSASRITGEEQLDQDVGHRLRVLSNGIELLIRQFRGFIVQKLAASSEAVSFGVRFEVGDVAHTLR